MDLSELKREIDQLPWEQKKEVLTYLHSILIRRENLRSALESIKGRTKNLANEDAQEYIKRARDVERPEVDLC